LTIFNDIRHGSRPRQQSQHSESSDEATPAIIPFPDPPATEVFQGTAGQIVRLIEPHTEADPVGLLATLLVMFGNALGRSPHTMIEASRHGTNEFCLTVGESATARKGTALAHIRRLFEKADPHWLDARVVHGLSSGQGVVHAVRDQDGEGADADPGVVDKRLMVVESEFSNVLRVAAGRENTLSPTLRNCWDGTQLQNLTRTKSEKCTRPHVSIVGHITNHELKKDITSREMSNGFLNRFLIVAVRRSKVLPFGGKIPPADIERACWMVENAIRFAREASEITLSPEAIGLWPDLYEELTELPHDSIGSQLSRGAPHVRRLAMLYALLDRKDEVSFEHLAAAASLWDFSRRSVNYIFGDAVGDKLERDILKLLEAAGEQGMKRSEIRASLGSHMSSSELTVALQGLEKRRAIRRADEPTGGRTAERWSLIKGES
jgi:hypothetical protein